MKSAVFTFGRFNPITIGHEKVIDKVVQIATRNGCDPFVFTSTTHDTVRNPLIYEDKIKFLTQLFPDASVQNNSKALTAFHVCKILSDEGYRDVTMVVGEDRVEEFDTRLRKYVKTIEDPLYEYDKHYNFNRFTVVSAGERNPSLSGVEGISGTKLREMALAEDFEGFRAGSPKAPVMLTRKMYNAVRNNLRGDALYAVTSFLHESAVAQDEYIWLSELARNELGLEMINENNVLKEQIPLEEGIHDVGLFKAVFLAGGPGSGKDFMMKKLLGGTGLSELNSDTAFEMMLTRHNISKVMTDHSPERDALRGRAKQVSREKETLFYQMRKGVIINGTADDREKMTRLKAWLESMGYETAMIFINTLDDVSQRRNIERGQRGGREVPEAIRKEKWLDAQKNIGYYQHVFNPFFVVDNSHDLDALPMEKRKEIEMMFNKIYVKFKHFVAQPVHSRVAHEWMMQELTKRGVTQYKGTPKSQKFGSLKSQTPTTGERNESISIFDQMRNVLAEQDSLSFEQFKTINTVLAESETSALEAIAGKNIPFVSEMAIDKLERRLRNDDF